MSSLICYLKELIIILPNVEKKKIKKNLHTQNSTSPGKLFALHGLQEMEPNACIPEIPILLN